MEHAALAEALNCAIFEAAARAESSRQRPAPNEVLDYLNGIAREAGALLDRLGFSHALDPLGPVRTLHADWFVHLRRGLDSMKGDLPFWLGAHEVVGLGVSRHVARGRKRLQWRQVLYGAKASEQVSEAQDVRSEVASALLHAAPTILALMATAAAAGARGYSHRKEARGTRPDVFRRILFHQLVLIHEQMFGVLPRTRDSLRERCGPSVKWVKRVLILAAWRARKQNYTGTDAVRGLARRTPSTLAKQLEEAGTGIRRTRSNSSAVTDRPPSSDH